MNESPEEEALLADAAASRPELDGLLVYADWLEERNELTRAEIVRLEHAVSAGARAIATAQPPAVLSAPSPDLSADEKSLLEEAACRFVFLVDGVCPRWLRRLAPVTLAGTSWEGALGGVWWHGTDADITQLRISFFEDLTCEVDQSGMTNVGRWAQVGSLLTIAFEGGIQWEGVVVAATRMYGLVCQGRTGNVPESSWRLQRRP